MGSFFEGRLLSVLVLPVFRLKGVRLLQIGIDNLKKKTFWSQLLFLFAGVSVILSAVGAFGVDIYLASTQWLLVGIFFGVSGIYVRLDE